MVPQRGYIFIANAIGQKIRPNGAGHITRVSPRWGEIGIVAPYFYKYFAPLGRKYPNAKRPNFELKNTQKKRVKNIVSIGVLGH